MTNNPRANKNAPIIGCFNNTATPNEIIRLAAVPFQNTSRNVIYGTI